VPTVSFKNIDAELLRQLDIKLATIQKGKSQWFREVLARDLAR
jgi:hypothetical protein